MSEHRSWVNWPSIHREQGIAVPDPTGRDDQGGEDAGQS